MLVFGMFVTGNTYVTGHINEPFLLFTRTSFLFLNLNMIIGYKSLFEDVFQAFFLVYVFLCVGYVAKSWFNVTGNMENAWNASTN